jgi:uncharacterized protein (TIGR03083 family)
MLQKPEPIIVLDLFDSERQALFAVLDGLPPDAWFKPTVVGSWTVKDIAAHLVADDLGRLARQRDGHREPATRNESLKALIDRRNAEWAAAMRRLSPRVIRSLLQLGGEQTRQFFGTIDPIALGRPVSWAGPEPAPNWLDLARELTERWHHQQQIRDAVGAPSLDDPTFLRPVLATFAFALVPAYDSYEAALGTTVALIVKGRSGGEWTIARVTGGWELFAGKTDAPTATVEMDEDTAWRMYVGWLSQAQVRDRCTFAGDLRLGTQLATAFALVS